MILDCNRFVSFKPSGLEPWSLLALGGTTESRARPELCSPQELLSWMQLSSFARLDSRGRLSPHELSDCEQLRLIARQERTGGDLTLEVGGPAAGDWALAVGAVAIRGEAVVLDLIAVAFD